MKNRFNVNVIYRNTTYMHMWLSIALCWVSSVLLRTVPAIGWTFVGATTPTIDRSCYNRLMPFASMSAQCVIHEVRSVSDVVTHSFKRSLTPSFLARHSVVHFF